MLFRAEGSLSIQCMNLYFYYFTTENSLKVLGRRKLLINWVKNSCGKKENVLKELKYLFQLFQDETI